MRMIVFVLSAGCVLGSAGWFLGARINQPRDPLPSSAISRDPPYLVSVTDALSMPIFDPPRNTVTSGEVLQPAATMSEVRLQGITYTARRRAALLSFNGKTQWLAPGETIDQMTITKLERDAVEVELNGAPRRLELFKSPQPVPSEQPAVGAAAPPASKGLEPASAPPGSFPPPSPSKPSKGDAQPQAKDGHD